MSISQPCTYWLVIERVDKQTLTKISMRFELQTYLLIYKTNLKVENFIKIKAARAKVLYSSVFFILKITVQTLKCRHRSKSWSPFKNSRMSLAWRLPVSVTLALGRQKQVSYYKFMGSLGYIVSSRQAWVMQWDCLRRHTHACAHTHTHTGREKERQTDRDNHG